VISTLIPGVPTRPGGPRPFFSPVTPLQVDREEKNASTEETRQVDVVVPAPADRAARQAARPQLGRAERAPAADLDQSERLGNVPIHRQYRARGGLDVDDVIVVAAVLVRVFKRAPPGREGEPTIPAREVSEIGHGASIAAFLTRGAFRLRFGGPYRRRRSTAGGRRRISSAELAPGARTLTPR